MSDWRDTSLSFNQVPITGTKLLAIGLGSEPSMLLEKLKAALVGSS